MKLKTISSGSEGNCYVVEYDNRYLVLDAGVPEHKIMQAVDYKPSAIIGVFITHWHNDHSKAAKDLIKKGIHVSMPQATADALSIKKTYCLHIMEHGERFNVRKHNDVSVMPFDVKHDVPNMGYLFKLGKKKIVYITDAVDIPVKFKGIHALIVECNFINETLLASDLHDKLKQRIANTHLSLEILSAYVKSMDRSKLKSITLVHISDKRGRNQKMIDTIQNIVGDKVKVRIAKKGRTITL
jgi:phosphoribosyl 1,2-cyclic phosphodiesterase